MAILRVGVGLTFNGINGDFTTSGIVTAASFSGNVIGNIVGIASTARSLSSSATGSDLTLTTGLTVGSAFIKPTSVGLGATDTTGRNAGVGTATGTIIYNSSTGLLEYYNGTNWSQLRNNFDATGGTKTTAGGKTIHTFTGSGTFTVNSGSAAVDYLVVAGGGGGAGARFQAPDFRGGHGGGAGGFRTGVDFPVVPGLYSVTVGGGGNGAIGINDVGTVGNPSVFSTITSLGGGSYSFNVASVGSGAGGSNIGGVPVTSQSGTPGQGNPGGNGSADFRAGGGGGGAGGSGSVGNPTVSGGPGGNGLESSISGSPVIYAGGGGGNSASPSSSASGSGTAGSGGPGGGGAGNQTGQGTPGTTNRGGGAGAGHLPGPAPGTYGGSGGSGIVIIAYPS